MEPVEESRELRCLTAVSDGRRHFYEQLVRHATEYFIPSKPERKVEDVIPALRGDLVFDLAQFFYVVDELDLLSPSNIGMLIERHNADMEELTRDAARLRVMALNVQRVREGIFSPDQRNKVFIDNGLDANGKVRLDQSDLSKFMAVLMSPESCRQSVLALVESGVLHRHGSTRIFVSSDGTLETYFREHLTQIDRAITGSLR